MPNAVTHVLIAIIIADLIRDYVIKDKRFKLKHILIIGIAALLPDIDYLYYFISYLFFGVQNNIHPAYTHNLLIPSIFLIIAFIFKKRKISFFDKKNKVSFAIMLISIGYFSHLLLDFIAWNSISLIPLGKEYGLNLIPPTPFGISLVAGLDAIILILWLWHEEVKHKIKDFI